MPKVSVIVPCFNHAKFLRQRIASILNQTYTNFELILLDDCSNDGSRELLLSYRDNPHVTQIELNSRNTGCPFLQWEKGIRLAQGEYIWIAESDDYAEPEFLATTVALLDKHPEARLCLTGSSIVDANNDPIPADKYGLDPWEADGKVYVFPSKEYLSTHMLDRNSVYNASMVLFRNKDCLHNITPHYQRMRYCGDWMFWIEQIRKGSVIEVHSKLNYFRKHGDNTTEHGTNEGRSLGEIAFIRHFMYRHCIENKAQICQDFILFYKIVRHFPVSTPQRKKELHKIIAREGRFSWLNYRLAKLGLPVTKYLPCLFILFIY